MYSQGRGPLPELCPMQVDCWPQTPGPWPAARRWSPGAPDLFSAGRPRPEGDHDLLCPRHVAEPLSRGAYRVRLYTPAINFVEYGRL